MELYAASKQWASRPVDERFSSIKSLYEATKHYADRSIEREDVPVSTLRVEAQDGDMMLCGGRTGNAQAMLTHWAFGQLATKVGAPASYLRNLPATLAAQNLNVGLKQLGQDPELKANILFHKNGNFMVRSVLSDKYYRIWNHEVAERLLDSANYGWRLAPAWVCGADQTGSRIATAEDVKGINTLVKPGDRIVDAGAYASDHDMFVLLVNGETRVKDGTPEGLSRGIIIMNSEVGASSLRVIKFLYRYTCGNLVIWQASNVEEVSIRHMGAMTGVKMANAFAATMTAYANESVSDEEAKIATARRVVIGATKEEVLDVLFGKRIMSRAGASRAYDAVVPEVDGAPNTVWGMVQGITRASQVEAGGMMDNRVALDRAAAKAMALAF